MILSFLSLVLRFFTFFPSVIDHDESTYFEIARMMLEGKVLYTDMVDIKPPGIFLILAMFEAIFGYSIFVLRLLTALWIALTALMVYKAGMLLIKNKKASVAASVIYIFMISTWSFYGISVTPEIFFNLFTIVALYLLLKKQTPIYLFLAGLSAGLGFIVKYLVLFDFTAIILVFIILGFRRKDKIDFPWLLRILGITGLGFALPFLITNLVFYLTGHFDAFYSIVYQAPFRYPSAFNAWKMIKFIMDFQLRFAPVFFLFYYALTDKKLKLQEIREGKLLLVVWVVFSLVAVMIAGRTFGHYTIELMLPVCMLAGIFFHSERQLPGYLQKLTAGKKGWIILLIILVLVSAMKIEYVTRKDVPREIAAYLKPRLKPDDVVYTGNYHHIIYFLLKKDSPTKYVHRSLLLDKKHIKALNIDTEKEFNHIMDSRPEYIITEKEYPPGAMHDYIEKNYRMEKDFGNEILLFKRIGN